MLAVKSSTGTSATMVHGLGLNEMSLEQPLDATSEFYELIWLLAAFLCWKGKTVITLILTRVVEPLASLALG
jgi:hypothetical protein